MKKIKKIAASIMAVAAMATSMVGISASAANEGDIEVNPGGATLTNKSGSYVWGTATFIVYDRSTGAQVDIGSNGNNMPNNGALTANVSTSYDPVYNRFKGVGALHVSSSYMSPYLWSDSKWY